MPIIYMCKHSKSKFKSKYYPCKYLKNIAIFLSNSKFKDIYLINTKNKHNTRAGIADIVLYDVRRVTEVSFIFGKKPHF